MCDGKHVLLSCNPSENQPTWDSDDEIDFKHEAKRRKSVKRSHVQPRLAAASFNAAKTEIKKMVDEGYNVFFVPLNTGFKSSDATPIDVGKVDVEESKDGAWRSPTRTELKYASEAIETATNMLLQDEKTACLVISTHGGDAARLVAGCIAKATKKTEKGLTVGTIPPPSSNPALAIHQSYSRWTRITARAEILKFAS